MTIKKLHKANEHYIQAQEFNGYINQSECDFITKNINAKVELAVKFYNLSIKFDLVNQNKKFILTILKNLKKELNVVAII